MGDDVVVGVCVVDEEKYLLTVTEGGMGKRTSFDDFREMKHRGGRGVACHKLTEKSGKLAAIQTVGDDDDVMMITDKGTIIRMSVSNINVYSRTAGGVIVMRLADDTRIITLSRLEKLEEIEQAEERIDEQNRDEAAEIENIKASVNSENDFEEKDENGEEEE